MTTTTTPATAATNDTTHTGGQPDKSQTRIEIFTDGSCIGNPGHGGWGGVILRKDALGKIIKKATISGHDLRTTNNRMEMTAVCAALEALGPITAEPIAVFCDASLIPNAMTDWLPKWKAKGWKKGKGGAVENRDLWERLEAAAAGRNVTWHWVRGHNGTRHNEEADKLAYAAAREAEEIAKG
jgi:ribonuclease HI